MNFHHLKKTWIVAEIGVNHEGSTKTAEKLIRKAAEAGADAVKFQTYTANRYVSIDQPERYARVKKFEISYDEFRHLARVADSIGLPFFSTPLSVLDSDFLDQIVPLFKISSGDLTYLKLIRHIALKNKPIILSTGLGTSYEITAAVKTILDVQPDAIDAGRLLLMHCVSAYPTPAEEANLRNILWLKEVFGAPVGYSDHTLGIKACELAVALGAKVVEKHFTYRKQNQSFHDHALSADPKDMKALVSLIRSAEIYLGKKERKRTPSEERMAAEMRRSLAATVDMCAGTFLKEETIMPLRPAWGVPLEKEAFIIGKKLKSDIKAGELIMPEDVDQ